MPKTSLTHPIRIDDVAVPGTTGAIGMTFCPGKVQKNPLSGGSWERDLGMDMRAIEAWGAKALVSLMEEHEFEELLVSDLPMFVPQKMQYFRLPIPDGGVPGIEWEREWEKTAPILWKLLMNGQKIVIHCKGGLGRTGLLAARLLVEFGLPPEDAMKAVRKARPGAIETRNQEAFVRRQSPIRGLGLNKPYHRIDQDKSNRYRGCLLAGAVGDALGAPVEFLSLQEIRHRFGAGGIRDFVPAYGRVGAITDDTQMTLFTAEGLLRAHVRGSTRGICHLPGVVHHAYLRWLKTQGENPAKQEIGLDGWLFTHRELFSRRAPGTTCLMGLKASTAFGDPAINDSKGCGGVMRAAPLGLMAATYDRSIKYTFTEGCEIAALTHGHPTGQLPSGVLAVLIQELVGGGSLEIALATAKRFLIGQLQHEETLAAIEQAEQLAQSVEPADACLAKLGQGWVAEEALAIALFCALRAKSLEEGIVMAVNITGDSDSTGSIAGNILGAMVGMDKIPARWLEPLELKDVILELADDLATFNKWPLSSGYCERSIEDAVEEDYWCNRYPGW